MSSCKCTDIFFWEEWVRTTSKLKSSGYDLNIPIGKGDDGYDLVDEKKVVAKRLRERITGRYKGRRMSTKLLSDDLGVSYTNLRRKIGGFDTWDEELKRKVCEKLNITPKEEHLYFYEPASMGE